MKIEFKTDNAAFEDDYSNEILSILKLIGEAVAKGDTEGVIFDTNGNRVGKWKL